MRIRSNQRFRAALALFGLATLGIFGLPGAAQEEKAAEIGSPAPDFSLPDLSGHVHRLSDYKGKIVVLEWTNPHCPFVVRHYEGKSIPDLQRKSAGKGVVWLTINSTSPNHDNYESPEKLKEIYTGWNAGFTALLMDPEGRQGSPSMPGPRRIFLSSTKTESWSTRGPSTATPAATRPKRRTMWMWRSKRCWLKKLSPRR